MSVLYAHQQLLNVLAATLMVRSVILVVKDFILTLMELFVNNVETLGLDALIVVTQQPA